MRVRSIERLLKIHSSSVRIYLRILYSTSNYSDTVSSFRKNEFINYYCEIRTFIEYLRKEKFYLKFEIIDLQNDKFVVPRTLELELIFHFLFLNLRCFFMVSPETIESPRHLLIDRICNRPHTFATIYST